MSPIALARLTRVAFTPVLIAVTLATSGALGLHALAAIRAPIDAGPAMAPVAPAAVVRVPPAPRDPAGLLARNMFCSTCTGTGTGPPPPPPGAAGASLRLIATHVVAAGGWATLLDPVTGVGGAYPVGATLPGGARLVEVARGHVLVRNPDGSDATLALARAADPPAAPAAAPAAPVTPGPFADRVRAAGPDRYEIDRRLIGELMASSAGGKVPGVRIAPVTRDGDLTGLRVASAREGSLARVLGLAPGDVIEQVDGGPVTPDRLMELYGRVGGLQRVELGVRRAGAVRTLTYDLR